MKYPCASQILFDTACQYGGEVDTDKHAYSVRKLGNTYYRYHYLDWERSEKDTIIITSGNKKRLAKHLVQLHESGTDGKWVLEVLHSLGYKPDAES